MKVTKKAAAERPGMSDDQRSSILNALAMAVSAKLRKAVTARQASGIEQVWTEDEEFYQGIDDANRHEFGHIMSKPNEGGRDVKLPMRKGSTLFPNITAPYVDAAAAKISDMLLPTDDRNFVLEPTPVPDVLDEEEGFPEIGSTQEGLQQQGAQPAPLDEQSVAPAQQGLEPPVAAPAAPAEFDLKAALLKFEGIRLKAQEAAKRAQETIDDHLVECSYHTELRQVIHDAARLGTGVLKGPFPKKITVHTWAKDPTSGERVLLTKIETKPVSARIDLWNLFPAPGCGDNIHRGSHLFERDYLTSKMLADLKGGKDAAKYLDAVIDLVLKDGPKRATSSTANRAPHQGLDGAEDEEFEVWRYYGEITAQELEAVGCECEDEKKRYPVILTIVNDLVIKASMNPLDSGEFPFDVLPWKKRPGMPWGTGVSRQARVGQRVVTAATRNLMDNAGASAKPHKVLMTDLVENDGDPWTWKASPDVVDVSKAMTFFVQPSLQEQLTAIIQLGERMVEMHTGLPMIVLGMQGDVQETASGRALQNNNGSMVLRRLARQFDGCITEPHIRRYHTWLMLYSEDDTLKGDFKIKARGSAALVERDLQNQQLPLLMTHALTPQYGLDPERTAEEYLKSQRFDPKAFKPTDEKKAEMANQPPPPMPQVEVARIREEGATARHQADLQDKQAERAFEAQQADVDRQVEQMALNIEAQLESAKLSSSERLALDDIKATLAGITLKIRTQRELSAAEALKPPTEPAGRAAPGKSFHQ